MTPKGRREEYAEATREALLEAALAVFAEHGYAGASLDGIAAQARVTKGAVYHHFSHKADLFRQVAAALEERAVQRLDELVADEVDGSGRLLACLRAVLEATSDPVYARLVLGEGAVLVEEDWTAGLRGRLRTLLEGLVAEGSLEAVPVPLLAEVLWGASARAGSAVAGADDPRAMRRTAGALLLRLVGGLWSRKDTAKI